MNLGLHKLPSGTRRASRPPENCILGHLVSLGLHWIAVNPSFSPGLQQMRVSVGRRLTVDYS